jgi:MSHA biogenesis protein MshN
MSLINKMLQDLDARGGNGARADASSAVRPVSYGARKGLSPAAVIAGVVALAVIGGGFAAWKFFKGGQQPAPSAVLTQPPAPPAEQPAVRQPEAAPPGVSLHGANHPRNGEEPAVSSRERADGDAAPGAKAPEPVAKKERLARQRAAEPRRVSEGGAAGSGTAKSGARPAPVVGASGAPAAKAAHFAPSATAAATTAAAESGLSSQQKAENEYRRALLKLQDARVSEALAGLEQAVYLYPRHEAARQTLVSLLMEAGRTAEAIRHLTFATNLEPRQANMAMLLARLQLEHGGNALETLQRSLPYAESNADYRALMAGVLQRANRHKEAADHYQAAVRLQPGNAVWWMGMGISLQADHRNAEARVAFQRAHDSGRLAPELQSFVERRLQQLN